MIGLVTQEEFETSVIEDPLETALLDVDSEGLDVVECKAVMDASTPYPRRKLPFESLDLGSSNRPKLKSSLEEPLSLELKALPSHLQYAYLGSNNTLLVIIASDLTLQ